MPLLKEGYLVNGCLAVCDRCGTPIKKIFRFRGNVYGSECIYQVRDAAIEAGFRWKPYGQNFVMVVEEREGDSCWVKAEGSPILCDKWSIAEIFKSLNWNKKRSKQ